MLRSIISIINHKILNIKVKREGGQTYSSSLRKYFAQRYNIEVGYGTYGCFVPGNIERGTMFGNYCSVGQGVKIFRANHPISYFTTHPLFYNPSMGYVKKYLLEKPSLKVGHDVWIGSNAIILPSCQKIGNGSIIGAGSIVTKDVPPYAIVAGNPAKVIKMRFPEEIIQRLEATQWWLWDKDELIKNKEELERIIRGE